MVQIAAASEPWTLPADVLAVIHSVYKVVGADDYSSSPIFPVKETKKKKPKPTLAEFTANLNKLSEETFDAVSTLIDTSLEQMDVVVRSAAAEYLVETASRNSFASELYARIFQRASEKWPVFYEKFSDRQDDFKDALKTGEEKQRTFLLFAIHLNKLGAIGSLQVLVEKIQSMVEACAGNADLKNAIEEWSELVSLLVSHNYLLPVERVKIITDMRTKTHPGISNKTVFKYMDMLDAIKRVS